MRKTTIRSITSWEYTWNLRAPSNRAMGKCFAAILGSAISGAVGGAGAGGAVAGALAWAPPAALTAAVTGTLVGAIGGAILGSVAGGCWDMAVYSNFGPSPFHDKSKSFNIFNGQMIIEQT